MDVEKLETSCIAGGNVQWCIHFGKTIRCVKRLEIELP